MAFSGCKIFGEGDCVFEVGVGVRIGVDCDGAVDVDELLAGAYQDLQGD